MKEHEKEEVRKFMRGELALLLMGAKGHIAEKDEESKKFYDLQTHCYIEKNGWELMFPLEKEKWPNKFEESYRMIENMKWPHFTTYRCLMDVIMPPNIPFPLLYFGYAVVEGKLMRVSFFVIQTMVSYQEMPQGMVIDPLAEYHKIVPSYYIGCYVPQKKYIEDWIVTRRNPLEVYVEEDGNKRHAERIRDTYYEAYSLQMTYEPEWFSSELIEFAKKENLPIPKQHNEKYSPNETD